MTTNRQTIPTLSYRWLLTAGILMTVAVVSVYYSLNDAGFISFDDSVYVYDNPLVSSGLTREGLSSAFSFRQERGPYWHPVTTLSHMTDCHLFGLDPGKHHLVNLMIHLVNTLLLFGFLMKTTGDLWKSAFVAAVFAVHPLNVESVAWITERKNLLCVFFWLLNMHVFVRYTKTDNPLYYGLFCLLFLAGIMSKPLMMTFPFAMLLINYWPLNRYGSYAADRNPGRIVIEVLPLLVCMVVLFVAGMYTGGEASRVTPVGHVPVGLRVGNALLSYLVYLNQYILPFNLSVFHPYPESIALWKAVLAGSGVTLISVAAVVRLRRYPWLFVGWFWFLGNLVTASGIIQKGYWPAHADRFTYLPMIGISMCVAWGAGCVWDRFGVSRKVLWAVGSLFVLFLALLAHRQAGYWKSGESLFRHAITVNSTDAVSMTNLALALGEAGKTDEAIYYSKKALELQPGYAEAHNNLGVLLSSQGKTEAALDSFRKAIASYPGFTEAHVNSAVALLLLGRDREAMASLQQALHQDPVHLKALILEAELLMKQGEAYAALMSWKQITDRVDDNPDYFMKASVAAFSAGKADVARRFIESALALDPVNPLLFYQSGKLMMAAQDFPVAERYLKQAIHLKPDFHEAASALARVYVRTGDYEAGEIVYKNLLSQLPKSRATIAYNLTCLYSIAGNEAEAVAWFEQALEAGFRSWETAERDPDLANLRRWEGYTKLETYYRGRK